MLVRRRCRSRIMPRPLERVRSSRRCSTSPEEIEESARRVIGTGDRKLLELMKPIYHDLSIPAADECFSNLIRCRSFKYLHPHGQ